MELKFNKDIVEHLIQKYIELLSKDEYDEIYKWETIKTFQDNWNLDHSDFKEMLEKSLYPPNNNLWAGSHYLPRKTIVDFADKYPGRVKGMFEVLFDESRPLRNRMDFFRLHAGQIQKQINKNENLRNYQDKRALMLYLALRYPHKYYFYKHTMHREFAMIIECSQIPKQENITAYKNVEDFLELCNTIKKILKEHSELLTVHKQRLNPNCYQDSSYNLLTQDFIYCATTYLKKKTSEETIKYWQIAPGEKARFWDDCKANNILRIGWNDFPDLTNIKNESDLKKLFKNNYPEESKISFTMLSNFIFNVNAGDYIIANKGQSAIMGVGVVDDDDTLKYNANNSEYRHYKKVNWLEEYPSISIRKYKSFGKTIMPLDKKNFDFLLNYYSTKKGKINEPDANYKEEHNVQYWWLNANPQIWDLSSIKTGERKTYTTYNERNNKRRVYKYFAGLKPGDKVVGYISTPHKEITSLLEITKGVHETEDGEIFEFEKIEDLVKPIPYLDLKNNPDLTNCEPLINNQGSLFKLTPEEYSIIQDLIDEVNIPNDPVPEKYSIEDALKDLFMSDNDLRKILNTLEFKKNIILQGPPGVGKTFIAKRLAYSLMEAKDDSRIEMIQFHQSYSYEDFIQGYRPTDRGEFDLKDGIFFDFCKKAQRDKEKKYFFIIDEINRGNLSKIFGELMMLIEPDKRGSEWSIPLTYSKSNTDKFYIPDNLYLIGTMNTADRSLALVDYALRRRFSFINLKPLFESKFKSFLNSRGVENEVIEKIVSRLLKLNSDIANDKKNLGDGFMIGHSFFCTFNNSEDSNQWYEKVIHTEISPLLFEYWFDDEETAQRKVDALLA